VCKGERDSTCFADTAHTMVLAASRAGPGDDLVASERCVVGTLALFAVVVPDVVRVLLVELNRSERGERNTRVA
jgi:hypothetical protein